MQELSMQYLEKLDEIAQEIQESEELNSYLEEEEESFYLRLKELFEPRITFLHEAVADNDPLQLMAFEKTLLHPAFEGLFLPKILGYSVLRGEKNEYFKYARPQNHFKEILMAICESPNFDILRKRIGQSIQMGFALSSDIWVTNLISEITNKRVRYFLEGQKLERYRRKEERQAGHARYIRQFKNNNFYTVEFPTTLSKLKTYFSPLKTFVIYRIGKKGNNGSIMEPLRKFILNPEFRGTVEHLQIMTLFIGFFDLDEKTQKEAGEVFNEVQNTWEEFEEQYFDFILELHNRKDIDLDAAADLRILAVTEDSSKNDLFSYYQLMDVIHGKGYINEEAQEAVIVFINKHEGLSTINECVRRTIYDYFARLINNLEEGDYPDFFESTKVFTVYMEIFVNQHFNQDIKELYMRYVRKLMNKFTDKRGKDYQDVKKFVSTTFVDLGFLKEKEVVELFKTRRKKKPTN
ncbi:MAG: hypothetical protein GY705_14775 [Bacteroidetes bacterium]|nr:hypothetical protein [Bacteroidota bacterium]